MKPIRIKSVLISLIICVAAVSTGAAQGVFKIGERITYTVSFDKFRDVAYAETYVASRGTLTGRDVIELRSKMRTLSIVNAAFYNVDEARTSFVDPSTGLPVFFSRTENPDGISRRASTDLLQNPSATVDLLSLIYKIRHSGGTGTATLNDGGRTYAVEFQIAGSERVTVPAGEFDTTIVTVKSEFFVELGFPEVSLNLTADDQKAPVVVRMMRNKKSGFRAEAVSIQDLAPEPEVVPSPLPPVTTPTPRPSPAPTATPLPYINNQPLTGDLAFDLGEALEYRVTAAGRSVATLVLRARERRQFNGRDALVLTATVTNAAPGNPLFALNDSVTVYADPATLAPFEVTNQFAGPLSALSQRATFDEKTGAVNFGAGPVEAPLATHSILSLLYAVRSFNLKPSLVRESAVNDTRVAVFWGTQPYVFTLRPSPSALLEIGGAKRPAQLVTVSTGDRQLDLLGIKIWLSSEAGRVPLRIVAGVYEADLVSVTQVPLN